MMREYIGEAAMYELLAEECGELVQAALKKARIIRGENPTPVSDEKADSDLVEEFTDVILCATELRLRVDPSIMYRKQHRFTERVKKAEAERSDFEKSVKSMCKSIEAAKEDMRRKNEPSNT